MSIASKESRETMYWLRLLEQSGYFASYPDHSVIINSCSDIVNILTKIIKTASSDSKSS